MPCVKARLFAAVMLLSTPVGVFAHHVDGDGGSTIKIDQAYSRAMLPVAKVGGGYLTIKNDGADDRLVSATSDRADEVQIHEMKMDNGIMEMRELKNGIPVLSHSSVELKPGSYHLMFINVAKPFKEGETVKATLVFEKAGPVDVEFVVGPVAGGQKPQDAMTGHEGHGMQGQ